MPDPKVLSPREYYAAVLEMLKHNRAMEPTDATFVMEQYDKGDPRALDAALALANFGKGREGGAWEAYANYRKQQGVPVVDLPMGIYRDPSEEFSNVRYDAEKMMDEATTKLVDALEAARKAGYTGDDTVPPPDTPTYRKPAPAPKPKVNVTVGQAELISPEEMLRRIKESKSAEEQAHKFMLGRPRNA